MRIVPRMLLLLVAACTGARATGGGGGGGHTGGNSAPVPAEVRKTVDATLGPNARITSEREGAVTIYEAAAQTRLELELSAAGVLQQTEVALPVAALPTAVSAALAGKGAIAEAEVVIRPAGVAFEVEVGDTEYVVDASGAIVEQHVEPGEADEAGEDDRD